MRHLSFSVTGVSECQLVIGKHSMNSLPESIKVVDSGLRLSDTFLSSAYVLPGGENVKSMDRVYELYQLIRISKSDVISGVGGGSILDLTGYAALTHGSINKLYLVPTTPLSQVMPPIGGRFSVNFEFSKDLIGTAGIPFRVLVDPFLSFDYYKSMGKCQLIFPLLVAYSFDSRLYNFLTNHIDKGTEIDIHLWEDVIWSTINAYVNGLKNFQRVTGVETAAIIQTAFRLKISYELALAFGGIIEIWLGVNTGINEKGVGKKLIDRINSLWGKSWPQRIDMSSLTELVNEIGKLSFWVSKGTGTTRGSMPASEFVRIIRNEYGIRLESLM